jgi:hypothetical protein
MSMVRDALVKGRDGAKLTMPPRATKAPLQALFTNVVVHRQQRNTFIDESTSRDTPYYIQAHSGSKFGPMESYVPTH